MNIKPRCLQNKIQRRQLSLGLHRLLLLLLLLPLPWLSYKEGISLNVYFFLATMDLERTIYFSYVITVLITLVTLYEQHVHLVDATIKAYVMCQLSFTLTRIRTKTTLFS